MNAIFHTEKLVIETTTKKEVERRTLFGLFYWNKVMNTTQLRDDIILWIPEDTIDNIWVVKGKGQRVKFIQANQN